MYKFISFFLFCSFISLHIAAIDLKGDLYAHDPSTLIKDGATYWHFFTAPGIGAAYSTDLIHWKYSSHPVLEAGKTWRKHYPKWTLPYFGNGQQANKEGNLWAPDVIKMNGYYYLYYSCSSFGSSHSAIGCLRSKSLNTPQWEDMGKVIASQSRSDFNAIDPALFRDDDGKIYMVYGSFSAGIALVNIDSISGKATSKPIHLAGGKHQSFEGASLFKANSYYYLVINRGACCRGLNSTYYLIVGRAKKIKGPYTDFRTLLPQRQGKYIGPGHFSLFAEKGHNYVTIHYYDATQNGKPQYDLLRMKMVADWPVLYRDFKIEDDAAVKP